MAKSDRVLERGGTDDAGIVVQGAGNDLGELAGRGVLGLVLGIGADGGQQGLSLVGNTAADADDLRLKGVDDVGDADADVLDPAVNNSLGNGITLGGIDDTGRFGGDQTLMVDQRQKRRFDELCLYDRGVDPNEGLTRENDAALRNRVDISGESEGSQILQKILFKKVQRTKIFDVFTAKGKMTDIIYGLFQSGGDSKGSVKRVFAVKQIKHDTLCCFMVFIIALHHGELVQIGHKGQILVYIQRWGLLIVYNELL